MVSVLGSYSEDLSSNPAGNLNFLYEKTKINEKEPGVGPSLKKQLPSESNMLYSEKYTV